MTGPTLDLKRYIPALLTFASSRLSLGASEIYRRLFGIGISEWRVLSSLAAEPDVPASRLCLLIGFDKALASRVIKKLSEQGFVSSTPDATHGSRWLLRLTDKGRQLHDQVLYVNKQRERILHEAFTPDEIETLVSLLRRVYDQAEQVNAYEPVVDAHGIAYASLHEPGAPEIG